ncbi:MAG: type II secretion system protein [Alphaproteobacteria bacterium]|nr:type II secretion system protein [Alphaproteobacteria bacterium]
MALARLSLQRRTSRERGFTLTEIAIVLGIIGLILGAIWVAAASVYTNQKIGKANTEVMSISQGIRALYATTSSTGVADNTDETKAFCTAGVFPQDMVGDCTTPKISNPWSVASNSTTVKTTSISAGAEDAFEITMTNIPQSGCVGLLSAVGGASRDSGLFYLSAGTTAPVYTVGTGSTLPLTPTTAAGLCGNGNNTVVAVFKLKG